MGIGVDCSEFEPIQIERVSAGSPLEMLADMTDTLHSPRRVGVWISPLNHKPVDEFGTSRGCQLTVAPWPRLAVALAVTASYFGTGILSGTTDPPNC